MRLVEALRFYLFILHCSWILMFKEVMWYNFKSILLDSLKINNHKYPYYFSWDTNKMVWYYITYTLLKVYYTYIYLYYLTLSFSLSSSDDHIMSRTSYSFSYDCYSSLLSSVSIISDFATWWSSRFKKID